MAPFQSLLKRTPLFWKVARSETLVEGSGGGLSPVQSQCVAIGAAASLSCAFPARPPGAGRGRAAIGDWRRVTEAMSLISLGFQGHESRHL